MKTRLIALASTALAVGHPLFATTPAHASAPTAQNLPPAPKEAPRATPAQNKLGLTVTVPPSMHPFRDDDVARAIADDVQSEFKRQGCTARVDYDFTNPDQPARHDNNRFSRMNG